MNDALAEVLSVLDLEEIEENLFRGRSPNERRQRVFGGQVAGQALVAASRTCEGKAVHSLHSYFLIGGDPKVPIVYQVERIRDGKSFATRRVVAIQHGRAIFTLSASFQKSEEGLEHQAPMPDAPDPETLPTWAERFAPVIDQVPREIREWMVRDRAIDIRHTDPPDFLAPQPMAPHQCLWIRAAGELPDDPLLHQHVVTYASDMSLLDCSTRPHAIPHGWWNPEFMMASLDHAIWFHRPFRADEWLLYAQQSPSASNARGFAIGNFFTRDGTLVATAAQEGLIRTLKPR